MICVLCLKLSAYPAASVKINSTEGQELDVLYTIEKHFSWIKVDTLYNADSSICRQCLQALLAFHQFYMQVENAHKLLKSNLTPDGSCAFPAQILLAEVEPIEKEAEELCSQIKIEPEILIAEVVKPMRRHDRARKKNLGESMIVTRALQKRSANASQQETDIEELYVPVVKNENLDVMEAVEAVSELLADDLSDTEEQPTEQISGKDDLNATEQGTEFFSSEDSFELISEGDGGATLQKLSNSQRLYSKKMLTSHQSDEYIAKHFKLSCSVCRISLRDFTSLKSHFRAEHRISGYVLCCGKQIFKRGLLVDHLHMHQNPAYYSCPHCKKVLSSRRYLEQHLERHEKPNKPKLVCKICDRKFFLRAPYARHLLMHKPRQKTTIPCSECGKNFATQYLMNQHLRVVHLNAPANICDKSLASTDDFCRYMEKPSGLWKPGIQCKLCGITLASNYSLKRHRKAMHFDESPEPHVCPVCSNVSLGAKAHRYHMKQHRPTSEVLYICPHQGCGKSLAGPEALRRHMKEHTGVSKYAIQCTLCSITLSNKYSLNRHLKVIHVEESQKVCPICSKVSLGVRAHKNHMQQHRKTRIGEVVRYTCPHCPKSFKYNASMFAHRKKEHSNESEEMF